MRLFLLFVAGTLTACGDGSSYDYVPLGSSGTPAIRTDSIDTGATLGPEEAQGQGLGVYVEYATGGAWHVFTVCDTARSSLACQWDIVASVAKGTLDTASADIDRGDELLRVDDGAVRLLLTTSSETDSVHLTSDAGASLQLDVTLDGNSDPAYALGLVNYVPAATPLVAAQADSNPVVFAPAEP